MEIEKRQGETELQHHKRLVYGKLVDKTLADVDYSELSASVYGQEYSSDVARRMMYGSLKTLHILDNDAESAALPDIADEISAKRFELQKERQRLSDQRTALNALLRERARQEEVNEIIEKSIRTGSLPLLHYNNVPSAYLSDSDLLVSLNDIHYGACVENYWNVYNSDVCRSMMEKYLEKILSIRETHGCENCIVWANGDLISGNIHFPIAVSNKENVIEQVKGVSETISQFLAALSGHFRTVTYVSVSGNHSRIDMDKSRSLLGERLDDLVEWYIAARLQHFDNIIIGTDAQSGSDVASKIDHTMYLLDVRGNTYCGVHGDFDGSQAKVQSLQLMTDKKIYAVLSGHLHHNKIDEVGGIKTIMAGSFLGMDDYCVQNRIVGRAEQMVCVCDESGVRCSYDVILR